MNRIAETQSGGAIVADESGITRDRTYRQAEFLGEVSIQFCILLLRARVTATNYYTVREIYLSVP